MWKEEDDKLKRTFVFKDFNAAFAFMTKVAGVADRLDHHPWWSNAYNKVEFELSTHDAGDKVTDKDKHLAESIDAIYADMA
ncbi:4a-hydroxytetrahydrobiopterin dehydratase [Dyadobacter sp. CY345]|uniref:4a-hydroxytetrahydrobiopterin dehydratase n=1 Tax=Dyadobacter sp. CY345 TaxID=2909335 RepID=UPI001F180336|nr:4a-hydroxytetrahydrobiopterin dehydratase [Dyadobacter sp. CY345]MCF2443055.1 4a-hydroxytetrahydrobiopterin dehydratase [Dyadobacter sp. CY345]